MLPLKHLEKSNTKNNLWIYILFFLMQKKCYAWELQSLIKEKFDFKPGRITPYRVLYSLETNKFVKSKTEERRRIYEITEKGKNEFRKAKDFFKKLLNDIEL